MDKASAVERKQSPRSMAFTPGVASATEEKSSQLPSEEEARKLLEKAIAGCFIDMPQIEILRITFALVFSTQIPELVLNQKFGISPHEVPSLSDEVWDAVNALASSRGGAITTVFCPKGMGCLPTGVWKLHALEHVELPNYAGSRINMRGMPAALKTIRLELTGAKSLQSIHLRGGAQAPVIINCPLPVTAYFYDVDNYALTSEVLAAPAAPKLEVANIEAKVAIEPAEWGRRLTAAFEKADAEQVLLCTNSILSLKIPIEEMIALLSARQADGNPGLALAFEKGNSEIVETYIRAVLGSNMSENHKLKLAEAKSIDGYSGYLLAFRADQCDPIKAYVDVVMNSRLPLERKISLLEGDYGGGSSLNYAYTLGKKFETPAAYAKAILNSTLENIQKIRLLQNEDTAGTPYLNKLLRNGLCEAAIKFSDLILHSSLSIQQKFLLLMAKCSVHGPGFYSVVDSENSGIVTKFGKYILDSPFSAEQKMLLLNAQNEHGQSGFYRALITGKFESVTEFIRLVLDSSFSDDDKFKLLQAPDKNGNPFSLSIYFGRHETIKIFIDLIAKSKLPKIHQIKLLAAGIPYRDFSLKRVMHSPDLKTGEVFQNAIRSSALSQSAKTILLSE